MMALTILALAATSASIDAFAPERHHRNPTFFPPIGPHPSMPLQASSSTAVMDVIDVPTKPIAGMKPGTSGLRKKVEVWQSMDPANEHYLENFIQSLINTATAANSGMVPQTYVGFVSNNEKFSSFLRTAYLTIVSFSSFELL
jgi:hypothetical protein